MTVLEQVHFHIVSPTVVCGSDPKQLDSPPVLRPPSLRGMLRFWTRAVAGPLFREVESALWGSTLRGQGVGLLPLSPSKVTNTEHTILQGKPAETEADKTRYPVSLKVLDFTSLTPTRLRLRVPDADLREELRAVVWTWLHLGGIGKRSRRGLGSLLWDPRPNDLLDGFVDFNRQVDLADVASLRSYLLRGLASVSAVFPTLDSTAAARVRATSNRFALTTINQIFIGRPLAANFDGSPLGLEHALHGYNWPDRPGRTELGGQFKTRLASPMSWRIFPLGTGEHVPVMTWSPRTTTTLETTAPERPYLAGLGFVAGLGGEAL